MSVPYNSVAIIGTTASGKTAMACALAHRFGGGIISLDARQMYKGFNLCSGKDLNLYTKDTVSIPYRLIDICNPEQKLPLQDWMQCLQNVFLDFKKEQLPVWFCGGSHLYLDALRKSFSWSAIPANMVFQKELQLLSTPELQEQIKNLPEWIRLKADLTSRKRLLRLLEIVPVLTAHPEQFRDELPPVYNPLYIGLYWPRAELIQRIEARLDERLNQGMIEEVENQLSRSLITYERLLELGLEYKFIAEYLRGRYTFYQLKERLGIAIRQYAKRQMTWFRHMERQGVLIHWFEGAQSGIEAKISELILNSKVQGIEDANPEI